MSECYACGCPLEAGRLDAGSVLCRLCYEHLDEVFAYKPEEDNGR